MKRQREMHEGPDAFARFKRAIATIIAVPKADVVAAKPKAPRKRRRAAKK